MYKYGESNVILKPIAVGVDLDYLKKASNVEFDYFVVCKLLNYPYLTNLLRKAVTQAQSSCLSAKYCDKMLESKVAQTLQKVAEK